MMKPFILPSAPSEPIESRELLPVAMALVLHLCRQEGEKVVTHRKCVKKMIP